MQTQPGREEVDRASGGGEGSLSAGDKEGGEIEPPQGRAAETEMPRDRLHSHTHGGRRRSGERLRPQFLSQPEATAEVEAEKLPHADHEGCGQKTVKGAGVLTSRAHSRWRKDASVGSQLPIVWARTRTFSGSPWTQRTTGPTNKYRGGRTHRLTPGTQASANIHTVRQTQGEKSPAEGRQPAPGPGHVCGHSDTQTCLC